MLEIYRVRLTRKSTRRVLFYVVTQAAVKLNKGVCHENNKTALTKHMLLTLIALPLQSSGVTDQTKSLL